MERSFRRYTTAVLVTAVIHVLLSSFGRMSNTSALPHAKIYNKLHCLSTAFTWLGIRNLDASLKNNVSSIYFRKRPETSHIDCWRALKNDKMYLEEMRCHERTKLKSVPLNMSCEAIRGRVLPPVAMKPTHFGIAFARIVYMDYEFIEAEVRSQYHPENQFCFSIDKKSTSLFHKQIKALSSCFPNIYITPDEFNVDRRGHYMNHAHHQCMEILERNAKWEYVILLQNHDAVIKSVYELPLIYKQLGGANDVQTAPCPNERCGHLEPWSAAELNFFPNESIVTADQRNATIKWATGMVQASLARETVEWLIHTANLTTFYDKLNNEPQGMDELAMHSLQISEEFDMPGRFTSECVRIGRGTPFISRLTHWIADQRKCATGMNRHGICVLGLEDIYSLSKYPHVVANKFIPQFDYSGVDCLHELIFNRTFLNQNDQYLQLDYYQNMPTVKYHKSRLAGSFDVVECTSSDIISLIPYP